jgi:antitoxin component of MazEF toxin-antitoxin module
MVKTLTPIGNGLGLVIGEAMLDLLNIDRETPLELRVSLDGKGIEIRPVREDDPHHQRLAESTDRMMDIHEEVFRKLAQ